MKQEIERIVLTGNSEELFRLARVLRHESRHVEDAYETALRGIHIPYNFNYYLYGYYRVDKKNGYIHIGGWRIKWEEFIEDKHDREDCLRISIREHVLEDSTIRPRKQI